MEKLIGLDRLSDLIETVIYSGGLENGIPLSILIVGEAGTAKSKTILSFAAPSIHVTNDMTSSGLFEMLQRDRENKVRHIMFPDMNAILSHKGSTTDLFFGNLLALMSEGVTRIDDGRAIKEMPHLPCGLIAAATPDMYDSQEKKWRRTGLKRRFLPIFFEYSTATKQAVNGAIRDGHVTLKQLQKTKIELPKRLATVQIPERESFQLENLSLMLAENLSWHVNRQRADDGKLFAKAMPGKAPIPFTPHLILRTLASAHALRAKRGSVTEEDLQFCMNTVDFCRYGSPVAL